MSTTMPEGGGVQYNGLWYTTAQWQASGIPQSLGQGGTSSASSADLDGKAILQSVLAQYGLTGLDMNAAWQAYVSSGDNIDYLTNTWLPTQPAFKAAFPAWDTWSKQGGSVSTYVQYQNNAYQEARAAGFPDGVVNQDTITSFINNGVSAAEVQERIGDASKAVNQLDKNSQSYLQARELGLSDGDLASIWFNPSASLPLLEGKLAAAQIGGAAANAGIGLDTTTADQLAKSGVSQSQAQQGFGQLAASSQLLGPLPGQQGNTMTVGQAAQGVFGTSASAAQQLQKTAAQRVGAFQTGGGFTSSSGGFTGAGQATGA